MEKLKSTAKSIWAKIPKTKTEFKYLFDTCVSYYKENKAWFHRLGLGVIIAVWGFILLAMLSNFFTLYFSGEETLNRASEVRLAVFTLTAWIGAPFLVWRTWIASKQANTAQEKAYTELFTKAIEQLGSEKPETEIIKNSDGKVLLDTAGQPRKVEKFVPNIEVRVGALYALERIMHDSDKDAPAIIDTLATYVRHNCGEPKTFEKELTKREVTALLENALANRYDIQTALTIIGRRPIEYKTNESMPNLTEVNLQGGKLDRFDLSLYNFTNAHLTKANLGETDLRGVSLLGADLQEADLRAAVLLAADLRQANLRGVDLLGADLRGADLREASFQEADLQEVNFMGANLQKANLRASVLLRAKLLEVNLQGANLRRADLRGTSLIRANLQGASLRGAFLQEADFHGANLQGAKLDEVQINDVYMTDASVTGVNFTKCKYEFDKLQEQAIEMYGHKTHTILPDGMKIPAHWSVAKVGTAEDEEQYEREWEAFRNGKENIPQRRPTYFRKTENH